MKKWWYRLLQKIRGSSEVPNRRTRRQQRRESEAALRKIGK